MDALGRLACVRRSACPARPSEAFCPEAASCRFPGEWAAERQAFQSAAARDGSEAVVRGEMERPVRYQDASVRRAVKDIGIATHRAVASQVVAAPEDSRAHRAAADSNSASEPAWLKH